MISSRSAISRALQRKRGFTLVELLVSMAILSVLLLVITRILGDTQKAWQMTNTRISQFREVRRAFDVIKGNLAQATLNTYVRFRYDNSENPFAPFKADGTEITNAAPTSYTRYSELQFLSGPVNEIFKDASEKLTDVSGHAVFFQAPLGISSEFANTPSAFNPKGYYVQFGDDLNFIPTFVEDRVERKNRFRLMEYSPPVENNLIFDEDSITKFGDWMTELTTFSRPVADNVVAMYFSPRMPKNDDLTEDVRRIAPMYSYNSAQYPPDARYPKEQYNQLPPQLDVVMVVIDEASAERLQLRYGDNMPFEFTQFQDQANDDNFRVSLEDLEDFLVNLPDKINFRIFTGTVALRNSKFGAAAPNVP